MKNASERRGRYKLEQWSSLPVVPLFEYGAHCILFFVYIS